METDFIGSISFADFEKINGLAEFSRTKKNPFSAHSDFHLQADSIRELLSFIEKHEKPQESLEAYQKIEDLLKIAMNANVGIFSFCD